ncbi:uncharacterized protein LOC132362736 isoform X2 [Balaenoptera ricei]|uniref:uncharacterized protein LOC132362736 isoform X2 n=1 Tax=Balaenoptera ricei TaxID=2746895 RepID=UPI0028BEC38E|nr:uncharacterized protein LOC132362736 isoform X2 [Balaenoptera ricei]
MDTTPPSRAVTVHSAPVFPSPPFTASAAIGHSAGGTSDPEAMDTTPPSRAVIVQSAPSPSRTTTHFTPLLQVLGTHHPVVAMPQPVPRLSYLKRRPKDRPTFQSYDRKLKQERDASITQLLKVSLLALPRIFIRLVILTFSVGSFKSHFQQLNQLCQLCHAHFIIRH